MIRAEHIFKSYLSQSVIDDFSYTFKSGQLNTVIGASGSGKTTLLRILLALEPPSAGKFYYDNQEIQDSESQVLNNIRQQTGVLFQGSALFDAMTVYQNVRFPLDLYSALSEQDKHQRTLECIARVMLDGNEQRLPSELSGGMKKRAALARAIVNKPLYLFCDEPNSGLDPITSAGIDELIAGITHELQTTTLLVTHDMNTVYSVADDIIFLHKGKLAWSGNSTGLEQQNLPELQKFIKIYKR